MVSMVQDGRAFVRGVRTLASILRVSTAIPAAAERYGPAVAPAKPGSDQAGGLHLSQRIVPCQKPKTPKNALASIA